MEKSGGEAMEESRGAGQVFRLHFEMFPARTLRSVSPSALRVYIWQRMQGRDSDRDQGPEARDQGPFP